jgi:hypothetical protein
MFCMKCVSASLIVSLALCRLNAVQCVACICRVRRSGMHCVRMTDAPGTGGTSVMIGKLVLKYKLIGRYKT